MDPTRYPTRSPAMARDFESERITNTRPSRVSGIQLSDSGLSANSIYASSTTKGVVGIAAAHAAICFLETQVPVGLCGLQMIAASASALVNRTRSCVQSTKGTGAVSIPKMRGTSLCSWYGGSAMAILVVAGSSDNMRR